MKISTKNLSDFEKIAQVLEAKGLSVSKAESLAKLGGGTIAKLKQRKGGNGSLHQDNLEKFLRTFHVARSWWDTGEGDIFEREYQKSSNEPVKVVPLDLWNRLERNFNNFEKNSEMFGHVLEKEEREKADLSRKNDELVAIIKSMIGGQIQPNKM